MEETEDQVELGTLSSGDKCSERNRNMHPEEETKKLENENGETEASSFIPPKKKRAGVPLLAVVFFGFVFLTIVFMSIVYLNMLSPPQLYVKNPKYSFQNSQPLRTNVGKDLNFSFENSILDQVDSERETALSMENKTIGKEDNQNEDKSNEKEKTQTENLENELNIKITPPNLTNESIMEKKTIETAKLLRPLLGRKRNAIIDSRVQNEKTQTNANNITDNNNNIHKNRDKIIGAESKNTNMTSQNTFMSVTISKLPCVSAYEEKYEYIVCGSENEDSKLYPSTIWQIEGNHYYILGVLSGAMSEMESNLMLSMYPHILTSESKFLSYKHGDKCGEMNRRSQLVAVCGDESEIISVCEIEPCQYQIILTTPLSCDSKENESLSNKRKEFAEDAKSCKELKEKYKSILNGKGNSQFSEIRNINDKYPIVPIDLNWNETNLNSKSNKEETEKPLKILWDFGSNGCQGWFIEAMNFVIPFQQQFHDVKTKNKFKIDMAVRADGSFCSGMPNHYTTSMIEVDIMVIHHPPDSFPNRLIKSKYVIGRSMFEVDTIPDKWVSPARQIANEIWVPASFLLDSFSKAGVPKSKLMVLPEAIDVDLYNPDTVEPMKLELPIEKQFKFLSLFKYEPRKGSDILLTAYLKEFKAEEDVCLVIKTYLFNRDNAFSPQRCFEVLVDSVKEALGYTHFEREKWPCLHVISGKEHLNQMPSIYKAVDAFVLPSRGEGWGLPASEAMAMELPTIVTDWGGFSEFVDNDVAYLINITGLVDVPKGPYFKPGQKWANPDVDHLRVLMRRVFENKKEREEKGRKARRKIIEKYSLNALNTQLRNRFEQIAEALQYNDDTNKEVYVPRRPPPSLRNPST